MVSSLAAVARQSDERVARAREDLVRAVRAARASGMTQQEIAEEIGRSQPEVSRLLRFHGSSDLSRALRGASRTIKQLVAEAGGRNLRVFGSVATGQDHTGSDVDLVFEMGTPLSLMQLGRLEMEMSRVVGASVELVPESSIRPDFRERILAEAVPL